MADFVRTSHCWSGERKRTSIELVFRAIAFEEEKLFSFLFLGKRRPHAGDYDRSLKKPTVVC
jgi:hypothetical protein